MDSTSKDGQRPLYVAACLGHESTARVLLEAGANPNWNQSRKMRAIDPMLCMYMPPLYGALFDGCEAVLKPLITHEEIDTNFKDNGGMTTLSRAILMGHIIAVRLLLAKEGVDLNSKNNSDWTALSYSAREGHERAVRLLQAEEKIDLNSKHNFGLTALSWSHPI